MADGGEGPTKKVAILDAAARGDIEQLAAALLGQPQLIDEPSDTDAKGMTAMHLAAKHGHAAVIELLVERGSKAVDMPNIDGRKPIHLAASAGHISVIEALVRFDSRLVDSRFTNGSAPVHFAAQSGHSSAIETLIRLGTTALDSPNSDGWTPMYFAAWKWASGCDRDAYSTGKHRHRYSRQPRLDSLARSSQKRPCFSDRAACSIGKQRHRYSQQVPLHSLVCSSLERPCFSDRDACSTGKQGNRHSDNDGYTPLSAAAFTGEKSLNALRWLGADCSNMPIGEWPEEMVDSLRTPVDEDKAAEIRYRVFFSQSLVGRLLLLPFAIDDDGDDEYEDEENDDDDED